MATIAGRLPAKWVIHAVGPIWGGGLDGEAELLASAYRASLRELVRLGGRSIAFPAISTGVYGYPLDAAAEVALGTIAAVLASVDAPITVRLVLFDTETFQAFADALDALPAD